MMFSYPYFKPPYYNRYSRYGYYYPNVPYTSSTDSMHTHKENVTKKQSNNTTNVNGVEQSKTQKGHSGVMSYKYSLKRCPYKQFLLCTKKGRTFF